MGHTTHSYYTYNILVCVKKKKESQYVERKKKNASQGDRQSGKAVRQSDRHGGKLLRQELSLRIDRVSLMLTHRYL